MLRRTFLVLLAMLVCASAVPERVSVAQAAGVCPNQDEASAVLSSINTVVNEGSRYGLSQARIYASCKAGDDLLGGGGIGPACDGGNPGCGRIQYIESNLPAAGNWVSGFDVANDNLYDTTRTEAICVPRSTSSKFFSLYLVTNYSGDPYSLNQNRTQALCEPGDVVVSGGGSGPLCDSTNPGCGRVQYVEGNGPVTVGDREGWVFGIDVGGDSVYDSVQTRAVCLRKTALFDSALRIYHVSNRGSDPYSLSQNRTTALCDAGDIAVGGGGNAALCDASNPACSKVLYWEGHQKITQGDRQGWTVGFDFGGDAVYDTQSSHVTCIGLKNSCQATTECSDGIDNADAEDTLIDSADPGCHTDGNASNGASYNPQDTDETNQAASSSSSSAVPQCSDNIDNDGDGLTDFPNDPGCSSRQDNDEFHQVASSSAPASSAAAAPQCSDNLDNDADGATDFPGDFSCASGQDNDEGNPKAACQDGQDNDGDGLTDFPQDPGCSSRQDNDEFHPIAASSSAPASSAAAVPQCRDSLDNDGDGATDFPSDFSCSGSEDNDETFPKAQCQDGIDNDGDGLTDFPNDPGCASRQDNSEINAAQSSSASSVLYVPQCRDSLDNDGDGAVDYPSDFSCSGSEDNDETLPRAACQDGADNDGDGWSDAADPGCHSDGNAANAGSYVRQDNDETHVASASSSSSSSVSLSSAASSSSSARTTGCIDIRTETLNPQGTPVTPVAQFLYTLDNGMTAFNDAAGWARIENVPAGARTVSQQVSSVWVPESVSPVGGAVTVQPGTACAAITFRSRQAAVQQPSFTLTKTDGHTTAKPGDILRYTIVVTNTAQVAGTNVVVTDILPAELRFLSASDAPAVTGQTVSWTLSSVAPGSSRTLFLETQLLPGAAAGTLVRNSAQVTGGATATGEDVTVVEGGSSGAVRVRLTADPDPVRPGDTVEYEIEICNDGASSVSLPVTLTLPDEVEFLDASGDGDEDDGTVEWTVDVGAGRCRSVNATGEVREDEVEDGDTLTALAVAGGAVDEETTEVRGDGGGEDEGLSVSKEASPTEVFPGGIVEYTVTVRNTGDTTLEDIQVTDRLSGGGFSIIDDGGADRQSGNVLRWTIDELEDGESTVLRYRILIDAAAYPGASVRNDVSVEADGADARDDASAYVTVIGSLPQTGARTGRGGVSPHLRPYAGPDTAGALPAAGAALAGLGSAAGLLRRKWMAV